MRQFILILLLAGLHAIVGRAQLSQNITRIANWNGTDVPAFNNAKFNDCWGFTINGEEYGVIGSTLGTHIIHLPKSNLIYEAAFIPGAFQGEVVHRDFRTYGNYLYGVCDQGESTLQIIDLSDLPAKATLVYNSNEWVKTAHNIWIDDYSDLIYLSAPNGDALRILDISENPAQPTFVANFNQLDYVHDVFVKQDTAYLHCAAQGMHVFNFADPQNPVALGSLTEYPEQGYNHSGWLHQDGKRYVMLDETVNRCLKMCDVSDLTDITVTDIFGTETQETIPHNAHIVGDLAFVSYYFEGMRVYDLSDPNSVQEVGFYDSYPFVNTPSRGNWGIFAFLPSHRILISDRQSGLYVLEYSGLPVAGLNPSEPTLSPNPTEGKINVAFPIQSFDELQIEILDRIGRIIFSRTYNSTDSMLWDSPGFEIDLSGHRAGIYFCSVRIDSGEPTVLRVLKN